MEQTAFTVVTGLATILVLLPLPWHWSARNFGTLLYIAWTVIGCIIYFVNSIIWRGNLSNPAPVWCDITTKLAVGLSVALPAVSLCINRRLYSIATMKHASFGPRQKINQALIDFGIGLGIPCLVMTLHYVVQGHRYNVVEDIGCVPTFYITPVAIPLVLIWAPLLGVISMTYSIMSILAFMKQRRTFNAVLNSHNSSLNVSRYLRLTSLAGTDVFLDVPISIFILWSNTHDGLHPWISWADTHYNFSAVNFIPKETVKQIPGAWPALTIARWALPVAGILFFLFFGLAGESMNAYRRFFQRCSKPFHSKSSSSNVPLPSSATFQYPLPPPAYRSNTNNISTLKLGTDVESAGDMEEVKLHDYASFQSDPARKIVHLDANQPHAPANVPQYDSVSVDSFSSLSDATEPHLPIGASSPTSIRY